ncbi:MAG: hypothetical protein ABJM43_11725 [Paracoccaceae bacterium]
MAGDETLTKRQYNDRYFKFVDYAATTTPRKQYLRYTYDGWLLETISFYVDGSFEMLSSEKILTGSLSIERDDQFDQVGLIEDTLTTELSQRCYERLKKCLPKA